ncbi:MAG TPA: DUF4149 domain-containing protein [Verrucomicrobiae bacterium]|nr:DUF4149 domain-containing protein [Verrucomicrobiae bacterium]
MIVFLRFIGIINAAIWLGTSIFMTLGVAPAIFFSPGMHAFLGERNFNFYAGQIAYVFFKSYFTFHIVCALVGLAHLMAEKLYLGRPASKFTSGLLITLLTITLISGLWLQPKMHGLLARGYSSQATPGERAAAMHSFGAWHGGAQILNLFIICGIVIYVWRVNNPPDPTLFVTPGKFRG